ncbi:Serine--pyruvate aminotransferase / L-alanine:glyoxylate aminotransferase [Paramagnetospirillum magnetotacticum MS-1]|uniref:Serine--pyruvate aminotransferase / L-alanine:glyoxylate aminotransferase n=1 Tax=Paramagnetospirillum magnetotacticum MS-1 TaxID=272627 RepID=A0A0C2YE34_PARME|nr:alanine--glyoxylate aminotransferase family protein [Paramagnetospirillum magnetotacticum]KIL97964.1 Serine--pyruvate aminotransferase / L-alanine:glyoxylate aminotransferase [Paramagnetospirillum magnetotacticum MS-1]
MSNLPVQSFQPPLRILMGPGPSDVHPRVLAAQARPTIGHLDPAFVGMMDELKGLLQAAFRTANEMTFAVSGPGSAGMEACFVNLIEPGDTVVVCVNGVFGGRMKENVERCGARAVVVEDAWGTPVDAGKVEEALAANPGAKALAFVHAETSTGVESDAAILCALAHAHGALTIVDAVTSLGGIPVLVDQWGADAVYSGSQKCLSAPPGLSPVTFSPRAVEALKARKTKVQSWFLDLTLLTAYWGGGAKRTYHHTAPVNALYGLHESLVMLHEEGLDAAWARHRAMHEALRAGLEAMGLGLLVAEKSRLPQLNAVTVPDGVDEATVRAQLLARFGLEIGAGLGALAGKVWRIGLMGQSATPKHVITCLTALEGVLGDKVKAGAGPAAASRLLFG